MQWAFRRVVMHVLAFLVNVWLSVIIIIIIIITNYALK